MITEEHLLKHQKALINMVRFHPEVPYTFLIGGYACGKSFTDVAFMQALVSAYMRSPTPVTFGLIGASIKLLTQTVIQDFSVSMDMSAIPYKDNSQKGVLTVGNVRFVYLSGQDPGNIFAHNFNGVICDELDELPAEKILEVVKAAQERARKVLPASSLFPERDPFIVFTTTAQGLGGTYQLTKYFDEKLLPYSIIRARTQDNPHLAKSQIELLRKLYTEDEARAYLDGEFVNLTTGRVYPEFNRSKHSYMPFKVVPSVEYEGVPSVYEQQSDPTLHRIKDKWYCGGDVIYAGQDFNPGYNANVQLIERSGNIFVVGADRYTFVGDAPSKLRTKYPTNRIVLIPDASGKEILSGFAEELEENDVEVFWNKANPAISERVLAVNRLFRQSKLFVFEVLEHGKDTESLKNLLLGLEVRDFDDMGKPRKGKGPNATDHECDAFEYAIWRVIHSIKGYDAILDAIQAVHHHDEFLRQAA